MKTRYRAFLVLFAAILIPSGVLFAFDFNSGLQEGKRQYWEDSYGGDGCSGACGAYPCCTITIVGMT
jgi:hypothetical protein